MDSPEEYELTGPGDVTLRCNVCRKDIVRSQVGDTRWVHADDYIHLPSMQTDYDHEAIPDVMEGHLAGEGKRKSRSSNSPFDVIR